MAEKGEYFLTLTTVEELEALVRAITRKRALDKATVEMAMRIAKECAPLAPQ